MTAAAKNSSNGSGSQPWCRTVYVRQGRFFLTLLTVRVSPCQPASCKVYKTGRFTVREELQWVGQQTASQCQAYVVLADREAAWRQTALRRLQQELDEPADSKPLCSSGSTQHVASEVQQQAGCSTPGKAAHGSSLQQQSSPWWTRLLTAFRPRADVAASPDASPALDSGPVKVGCLQLGLSLKLFRTGTLSSIARALKFQPGRCFFGAGRCSAQSAAAGVQDATQQAPFVPPTDACDAAVTATKAARAGDGKQKVTAVQIDVIGYSLGAADALVMQVPA